MGLAKYPWFAGKFFSLALFLIGGGVLSIIITPFILILPHDRQARTRKLIRFSFRAYLKFLQILGMITLSIQNIDVFNDCEGKIIISNHPSLLDVVILMALIPKAQCIVKSALWRHPFVGILMRCAGYIRNDLSPEKFLEQCQIALNKGDSLIIFPEGTRSALGKPLKFHRGFANIAILTQAPIQTVLITCTPQILYKKEPWWQIPVKKPFFCVTPINLIDKKFYFQYSSRSIATRKLVEYLEAHYRKMLHDGKYGIGTKAADYSIFKS